ncbi:thiamine pyrophosphate-dependent dehydrogenase E1 component subunit alpha [Williamsia sp. CHRR-6]|uniref:thiamine pyrophosphate-dependent dehydrogenase E1 component subunit alpha n=1 Tax=Williamsia sp. CHRR-6 TaxID=2835871 RepID=UPI001BDB5185|nr:thiamine pyrophosphate-dependent dehydrogenase E1 component subunit alpha [Williamsia sp. CHRR-6]MBT0566044.1 thiamine pyrophosphate-dependent dehydrogenase E1 component subunit alpha [Williamsia sp. CHRR-6]
MSLESASRESVLETTTLVAGDTELARDALHTMWRIRRFEEAVDDLFARGLMHGTMHLSIGQEAVPTGACLALTDDDLITSTHRGHGHCIAKGADLTRMMAELLAKETGYCRGRGGSMHIADVATGNLGANGIVGGGIPIAAGAALAQQMRGTANVVVSFFGDGATNEGAFHEGLNLAAVWDLPVVFICENNKYGMSMSTSRSMNVARVSDRAAAYGMPGVTVDGNSVQEVYDAVAAAVVRARAGAGPTLVEAETYRYKGHSKSDQNLYRTREEIDAWRERDPITRFIDEIRAAGSLTDADTDSIAAAARDEIRAAIAAANEAPPSRSDELLSGVFRSADDAAEVEVSR